MNQLSVCCTEVGDSKVFMQFYFQEILSNTGYSVEHDKKLCVQVEAVRVYISR